MLLLLWFLVRLCYSCVIIVFFLAFFYPPVFCMLFCVIWLCCFVHDCSYCVLVSLCLSATACVIVLFFLSLLLPSSCVPTVLLISFVELVLWPWGVRHIFVYYSNFPPIVLRVRLS